MEAAHLYAGHHLHSYTVHSVVPLYMATISSTWKFELTCEKLMSVLN